MQNKNIYDICAPRRLFVFLHSKQVFMKNLFLLLAIVTFNLSFSQQWKEMANDININLYDVVAEAEAYFENIDKKKIKKGTPIKLNFDIQNISNISGEEVIQVYVKYKNAFYRTPNSSLIFFQKINLVSGEKKNIEAVINEDMMASIDEKGKKKIESGEFKLFVGGSSPGQRSVELGSSLKEIIFNVE